MYKLDINDMDDKNTEVFSVLESHSLRLHGEDFIRRLQVGRHRKWNERARTKLNKLTKFCI